MREGVHLLPPGAANLDDLPLLYGRVGQFHPTRLDLQVVEGLMLNVSSLSRALPKAAILAECLDLFADHIPIVPIATA